MLEMATFWFLVGAFAVTELYLWRRGTAGTVIGFVENESLPRFVERRLRVRLQSGFEVDAMVSGCTACLTRLVAGDPVNLVRHRDGYVVTVPWFEPRCAKSEEGRCDG